MTFEIHPKIGFGPLCLGMARPKIESILGAPVATGQVNGIIDCVYRFDIMASYRNDTVMRLSAGHRSTGITYKGIDVFKADPLEVLRMFERNLGPVFEVGSVILFYRVGMSLGGFHNPDLADRSITMDDPHGWDFAVDRMNPITFLK